jgi:hypothetical protein
MSWSVYSNIIYRTVVDSHTTDPDTRKQETEHTRGKLTAVGWKESENLLLRQKDRGVFY